MRYRGENGGLPAFLTETVAEERQPSEAAPFTRDLNDLHSSRTRKEYPKSRCIRPYYKLSADGLIACDNVTVLAFSLPSATAFFDTGPPLEVGHQKALLNRVCAEHFLLQAGYLTRRNRPSLTQPVMLASIRYQSMRCCSPRCYLKRFSKDEYVGSSCRSFDRKQQLKTVSAF
jgi:hypothetical protein